VLRLFLSRLVVAVPTLLAIIIFSFLLMRLAPGGPFDAERALPPAALAALNAHYHLDAPLYAQLALYLGNLAQGDFGPSYAYRDFTVQTLIAQGLPVSLQLGAGALLLALCIGLPLGVCAAWRGGAWRVVANVFSLSGLSLPSYVKAPLLVLIFSLWLGWLPAGGWNEGALSARILPTIALALGTAAVLCRLSMASLSDVLRADYIRTARAKALPARLILWRHALKPALIPVVSYLGPASAALLTGSVVVESVFGLPGMGSYFVKGALNRDYPLVLGVVIIYAALVILMNLLADMAQGWLDPRSRASS